MINRERGAFTYNTLQQKPSKLLTASSHIALHIAFPYIILYF
jgi:hypothetical protein